MKKLICIILILCAVLTGCAKEDLCGTPLAPTMLEMDGFGAVYELAHLIIPEEEMRAFLEEKGYADMGITTQAQVDRCISLIERAPIPNIDGEEPTTITVYPDDERMQVEYCFGEHKMFRYRLKDVLDNGPIVAADVSFKLEEDQESHSTGLFFTGDINGIPAEVYLPKMKTEKAKLFFEELEFFTIPEIRDKYAELYRKNNSGKVDDPGPPHICEINGLEEYFALTETEHMTENEIRRFLDEKGYAGNLIGSSDLKTIFEMVERTPIPQIDGQVLVKIDVYPDHTWNQVKYHFDNGMQFTYYLKDAEDSNSDAEDIRIIDRWGMVIERRNIVDFRDVEIDGIRTAIEIPKSDAANAREIFDAVRFVWITDLQAEYEAEHGEVFGPPQVWRFSSAEEFYALEDAMRNGKLEEFAEKFDLQTVNGYGSLGETAERVCEMVRSIEIPTIDGHEMTWIEVKPEADRNSVLIRYEGDREVQIDYAFSEDWESCLLEMYRDSFYYRDPLPNKSGYRIYYDWTNYTDYGLPIYSFWCGYQNHFAGIYVLGGTQEEAEKILGGLRYADIDALIEAEKVPLERQEPDITAKAWDDYEEVIEDRAGKKHLVPVYREESLFFDTNGLFYLNRDACFYEDQNIRQNASGALLTQFPTDAIVKRDDGWVYLIYETDTGYRLYLLIAPENGYEKTAGFPIVIKNRLSMEDFADLEKGDSIELVEKIDPVAALHKKQILEDWDLSPKAAAKLAGYGHPCASIHYLNDGILKIEYEMKQDQSLVISAIEHSADYTLVDASGDTVSYRINEEDLPEDAKGEQE